MDVRNHEVDRPSWCGSLVAALEQILNNASTKHLCMWLIDDHSRRVVWVWRLLAISKASLSPCKFHRLLQQNFEEVGHLCSLISEHLPILLMVVERLLTIWENAVGKKIQTVAGKSIISIDTILL